MSVGGERLFGGLERVLQERLDELAAGSSALTRAQRTEAALLVWLKLPAKQPLFRHC
jgi:hypothetical protein